MAVSCEETSRYRRHGSVPQRSTPVRPAHKRPPRSRSPRAPARRGRSSSCPRLPFCRTLRRAAASKYCRSLLEDVPIEANSWSGSEGTARLSAAAGGVDIARAATELTKNRSGRQETDLGGPARSARRPLARRTAAASIQYDSGLAQRPAAHSTGRVEVRQTACVRRSLAGMIGGGTRGREPQCPSLDDANSSRCSVA